MSKPFERLAHWASIKDGKLVLDNPRWFKGMIALHDDCEVQVIVERKKSDPSSQQRGYLFGVVYAEASRYTGYTPDELHEVMKTLHLKRKHLWRGSELVTVGSTTALSKNELAEFIMNVVLTLNEMGIEVPPPDKLYQFKD